MEPEGSSPRSHKHSTGPYLEPGFKVLGNIKCDIDQENKGKQPYPGRETNIQHFHRILSTGWSKKFHLT
jgi:hypothetical protein